MIVYNITIKIIPDIEDAWIQWQRQEHIPDIMASGLFTEYKMFRLLEQDDTEGSTYVLQFFAPSIAHYQRYQKEHAGGLQQQSFEKWGNQYIAFRTIMEIVN
jgi:hypothetical protein